MSAWPTPTPAEALVTEVFRDELKQHTMDRGVRHPDTEHPDRYATSPMKSKITNIDAAVRCTAERTGLSLRRIDQGWGKYATLHIEP